MWSPGVQTVADIEVGLLINSAGMSYDHAEYFEAVSEADIAAMIQVNIVAVTRVNKYEHQPLQDRESSTCRCSCECSAQHMYCAALCSHRS
jgi:short-subunit dehydrogenase